MIAEILLFQGIDELDALLPFEILQNAKAAGAQIDAKLVSLEGDSEIVGSHGMRMLPEGRLGAAGRPDVLIVPGGGWNNRAARGAWAEAQKGALPHAIAKFHEQGSVVASVCTGAMLLAVAGLVKGRPATTHFEALKELRSAGAEIVDARVVDDGDLITSGGVTSGLELGFWLVERYGGERLARGIARQMEYEPRGKVWRAQRPSQGVGV